MNEESLNPKEKQDMIETSISEFTEVTTSAAEKWCEGEPTIVTKSGKKISAERLAMLTASRDKLTDLINQASNSEDDTNNEDPTAKVAEKNKCKKNKEEFDTMKIDVTKMDAADLATLEALEKKYGEADGVGEGEGTAKSAEGTPPLTPAPAAASAIPEMHPEVVKALDDVKKMQETLALQTQKAVAAKYEKLGKNADELAATLVTLQKSGDASYNSYVALLDEQLVVVEKSGIFSEIGKNGEGSVNAWQAITKSAATLQAADPSLSTALAIVKACEANPELAREYEKQMQ